MFDLNAYLERIGLRARPSLRQVHRAHVSAIPFENLDPHAGVPIALDDEALHRKLIAGRRGGYCFEQNLMLKGALEALGADVEPMLARVRRGAPHGSVRPRTHLMLRVAAEGGVWHADVGFGVASLPEPIPFGPGPVQELSGWRVRVVEDGPELVLQAWEDGSWADLYGFVPEPVPLVDIATSNWYTCTHPRSPFVTGLIVAIQRADGTRVSLSDWDDLALCEQTPSATTVTPVTRAEIPGLLESLFGLPGFAQGADGRTVRATHEPPTAASQLQVRPPFLETYCQVTPLPVAVPSRNATR
ncbi:MAG: arylamine N-acetyltransferase family protein [Solirubrobacteraceae bacterium]